jgi:hypothetical protein
LSISISRSAIARASVPATVNAQVFLDRGCDAAFANSEGFRETIRYLAPGSLRWPTTGHNNLPKCHPLAPKHTYKTGNDFTTVVAGNLWDPDYNQPGYRDELDQPAGDGTGLAGAGDISEILNIQAYGALVRWLATRGVNTRPHIFMDWQSGVSEGLERNPHAPTGDYTYYRDPYLADINDVLITNPATIAALAAAGAKKLENRRFLRHLIEVEGLPQNLIVNMGGEDWRGWLGPNDEPLGLYFFPWDPTDAGDPNEILKYTWLYQNNKTFLSDLKAYRDSKGWTQTTFSVGFLESIEGGSSFPLPSPNITRNRAHFDILLNESGPDINWVSCSMHYRSPWLDTNNQLGRFHFEEELEFAFFTQSSVTNTYGSQAFRDGRGTFKNCRDYIRSVCTAAGYPNIDLIQMAGSVGDPNDDKTGGTAPEVNQFQRGLMASQMCIDAVKSGIVLSDWFSGVLGNKSLLQTNAGVGGSYEMIGGGRNYIRQPQYFAVSLFGQALQNTPDSLTITTNEKQLPTLCLSWIDSTTYATPRRKLALFLLNKSEFGRRLNVSLSDVLPQAVVKVHRYSEVELNAPEIPSEAWPVTLLDGGTTVEVALQPYSLLYVELEDEDTFDPECLTLTYPGGAQNAKAWHYATLDGLDRVLADGYFDTASNILGVGDLIDVIVVDAIHAHERTEVFNSARLIVSYNQGGAVKTRLTAPPSLTVSQLQGMTGVAADAMAWCPNEVGGACPVFYDGASWRRIITGSVIAAA